MERIHDEYSLVEKHAQDASAAGIWYGLGNMENWSRSLNIPVTQIVEEIAEVSKSSIEWRSIPNLYFEGIKVFLG